MEYHQDRFEDFSLMIYKNEILVAILPSNISESIVYSHEGLSYGGLLVGHKTNFKTVFESFSGILKYLFKNRIKKLIIKQIPKIYKLRSSDELDYLLFLVKAEIFRRDLSMTIILSNKLQYSSLRKRQIKKAVNLDLKIVLDTDMSTFWNEVLIPNLQDTYGITPVHSVSEINALCKKFPNNIKQYNAYFKNELLAGCTVFETETVAHLQYISTKKEKNMGALDFLIDKLISEIYMDKIYFDFGISNENEGKNVNLGLLNWKQSFGASPVVHDFYEVDTKNHSLLNDVML